MSEWFSRLFGHASRTFGGAIAGKGTPVVTAVSATTTATLLVAFNGNRRSLVITNNDAANKLFVGPSTVTAATGTPLAIAGGSLTDEDSDAAWYGITSAGTADVRLLEIT